MSTHCFSTFINRVKENAARKIIDNGFFQQVLSNDMFNVSAFGGGIIGTNIGIAISDYNVLTDGMVGGVIGMYVGIMSSFIIPSTIIALPSLVYNNINK